MKPSNITLWRFLPLLYRRHFIWQAALSIPLASLAFAPHVALGQMLLFLEPPTEKQTNVLLLVKWALVLGLGIGMSSWLENWLLWIAESRISIPMRQQLSTAIFDKATRLRSYSGDGNQSTEDAYQDCKHGILIEIRPPQVPWARHESDQRVDRLGLE